jgi:hypothetical protein
LDDSDRDTWHHCKGDTWHMLTWHIQLAWTQVDRMLIGKTHRMTTRRIINGHVECFWKSVMVPRGTPPLVIFVGKIVWTLRDLNPRPPSMGGAFWQGRATSLPMVVLILYGPNFIFNLK